MPNNWFCRYLYTQNGWQKDVRLEVDAAGQISNLNSDSSPQPSDQTLDGYVLPGIPNSHSHAFQYAMVGLAETGGSSEENFWTWRTRMYELALHLTPEQIGVIAEALYCDLLRHGYTSVAEFHYLHHDLSGTRYAALDEIGAQLFAAAERAGMHLCLIPVYYQRSNFGEKTALQEQRRFTFKDPEEYVKLIDLLKGKGQVGTGVHSLRAASLADLRAITQLNHAPFHIHIAEQTKEVRDCLAHTKKRPVQYFIDAVGLTEAMFLVHGTHLDDNEARELAQSPAAVVLCPSTEGNLGDGVFPLPQHLKLSGRVAVGSDSHVGLNPFEELRWMDYQHRLLTHCRSPLADTGEPAEMLLRQVVGNGLRSIGEPERFFAVGSRFDAVEVEADAPAYSAKSLAKVIPTLVYHGSPHHLRRVIAGGRTVVEHGIHHRDPIIQQNFKQIMNQLSAKL